MRVVVTGADGFVGRYLVRRLLQTGHDVLAACAPGGPGPGEWFSEAERGALRWAPLELTDHASVRSLLALPFDAIVHLAAVASGAEARRDPGYAWTVNAAGTARLVDAAATARGEGWCDPVVLLVSTGEVYGAADRACRETDPLRPQSPYAASKVGAELAGLETWRRTGLRIVIARPFPHSGPGQSDRYVVRAFGRRLLDAARTGAATVRTGSLEPVRDITDVRDVVAAYVALLEKGEPGEAYNVARGTGISLADLFGKLAGLTGARAVAEIDPTLMRTSDLGYLVGDPSKLRRATGWTPTIDLDRMLRDMLHAETH